MKYKELITDAFSKKANHQTNVAIGLIAGIAVGAAFAVLFSPWSGKNLRKTIAENFLTGNDTDFGNAPEQEPETSAEGQQKKAKSDIKELLHQQHLG